MYSFKRNAVQPLHALEIPRLRYQGAAQGTSTGAPINIAPQVMDITAVTEILDVSWSVEPTDSLNANRSFAIGAAMAVDHSRHPTFHYEIACSCNAQAKNTSVEGFQVAPFVSYHSDPLVPSDGTSTQNLTEFFRHIGANSSSSTKSAPSVHAQTSIILTFDSAAQGSLVFGWNFLTANENTLFEGSCYMSVKKYVRNLETYDPHK